MAYHISVFISHSWAYDHHYTKLNEWIFQCEWNVSGHPILFYDTSVPRTDPIHNARNTAELARRIDERVALSHLVVCPMGMYATHSTWIERELQFAKQRQRPILAINPWGQERKSSVVRANSTLEVGWTKDSVVNGIWTLTKGEYR